MTVALVAFNIGNVEPSRLLKHYDLLQELYSDIIIATIWQTVAHVAKALPVWKDVTGDEGISGLRRFLEKPASHVHYIDLARLLCWIETDTGELKETIAFIQNHEVTIVARTSKGMRNLPEPASITQYNVRNVINLLLEHYLDNKHMSDVASGSMGFSRKVTEFLIRNNVYCSFGEADGYCSSLEYEAMWIVLLKRAGFELTPKVVDGLIWERSYFYLIGLDESRLEKSYESTDEDEWQCQARIANKMIQYAIAATQHKII